MAVRSTSVPLLQMYKNQSVLSLVSDALRRYAGINSIITPEEQRLKILKERVIDPIKDSEEEIYPVKNSPSISGNLL